MYLVIALLFLMVFGKSIQNVLNKSTSVNSSIIETSLSLRMIPAFLCIPVLFVKDSFYIPKFEILGLSVIVGFLIGSSTILLVKSYNSGDISVVTPFYSLIPVFGGIFSWMILGQDINPIGGVFILLICAGVYIIRIDNYSSLLGPIMKISDSHSVIYIILYALIIGFVSPFDSLGVNRIDPFLWLFYTYLSASIIILFFSYYKKDFSFSNYNSRTYLMMFLIGFFTFVSVGSIFFLYRNMKVTYVLAIFMSNIVITSIIGFIFYDEKVSLNKVISILLMTVGAILLILTTQ